MIALFELATLNQIATALLIFKRRFYPHAPSVFAYPLMRSWPIGDQKPGFLVSWLPAGTQPSEKFMLFPHQNLPIPLITWFVHKCLALLPVPIGVPHFSSTPLLVFDPQDVMPANPLAEIDQGQAAEPTIGQQRTLLTRKIVSNQGKKFPKQFPLSLIPLLLLGHHSPGKGQDT